MQKHLQWLNQALCKWIFYVQLLERNLRTCAQSHTAFTATHDLDNELINVAYFSVDWFGPHSRRSCVFMWVYTLTLRLPACQAVRVHKLVSVNNKQSVMNISYYLLCISVWSHFIHIFQSFKTCSCVILYCATFVCWYFPMMQCTFWLLLSQSLHHPTGDSSQVNL